MLGRILRRKDIRKKKYTNLLLYTVIALMQKTLNYKNTAIDEVPLNNKFQGLLS